MIKKKINNRERKEVKDKKKERITTEIKTERRKTERNKEMIKGRRKNEDRK